MSENSMLDEAVRGLDRLDRLSKHLRDAGINDSAATWQVHSLILGYLAGALDDIAWADAEESALRYLGVL